MLVLQRYRDEDIVINDNIIVKVVEIRGDKVKLGITAPPDLSIHRREVYDEIQRDIDAASRNDGTPPGRSNG